MGDSSSSETAKTVHSEDNGCASSTQVKTPFRQQAWLQVLAGHLIVFDTFGYIGSWGLFQSYYQISLGRSPSEISWIGSIQLFLVYFVGSLSGRTLDAGYVRTALALGCSLQVVGIFTAAQSTRYWQLFLSQGICVGLGNGLTFTPMISLISTYYEDKFRPLAVSFAAAGAATGGMVFPAIARRLLDRIGVVWTVRVMGFVFLANSAIALALVRQRTTARKSGPLLEWSAFTELPYLLFTIGVFLVLWGVYFAYYFITIFATDIVHMSSSQSFYLIMALNGIGIPGRILPAYLVTVAPSVLHIFVPTILASGLSLYLWAFVKSSSGLLIWTLVYGFCANAVQALALGGLGSLTVDKRKMGTRTGMVLSIVSFASLTGPPIASALIDARAGDFLYAQIFGGTTMVCGAMVLVGVIWVRNP